MSRLAIDSLLEEYSTQRKYREAKRNQFIRRFQVLKQTFTHGNPSEHREHVNLNDVHSRGHVNYQPAEVGRQGDNQHTHFVNRDSNILRPEHSSHQADLRSGHLHEHSHVHDSGPTQLLEGEEQRRLASEENELSKQNQFLKAALNSIETEEKEKLQGFKIEIENVRNKYMDEIQKLTETAKKSKEQIESKILKIKQQSEVATSKNAEIEGINKQLRGEISEGNALMGTYATEIKKQYAQKIGEFQKIFTSSNQKIETMQKDFNEDEFIENTLKNQELLKSIEENAEKAEEASKILEDYLALLQGKKQILGEINSNNEMKEKEIQKMGELEGKMKVIMEKLGNEKRMYVTENNKMAQQLIEIKTLLVGAMNEAK